MLLIGLYRPDSICYNVLMTKKTQLESRHQRAAALWVAKQIGVKNPDLITDVTFAIIRGGYCETCEYESTGVEFKNDGKWSTYEFPYDTDVGNFLEQCVALLEEVDSPR